MISVPMKKTVPLDRTTIMNINKGHVQVPCSTKDLSIGSPVSQPRNSSVLNSAVSNPTVSNPAVSNPAVSNPSPVIPSIVIPSLVHPVQKGQKTALEANRRLSKIQVRLGWNVSHASCDVDVSAFMLGANGKVIGDSWFVFYGQTTSPDGSTAFSANCSEDRELISIDFSKLNSAVQKIVFVLTINEALTKHLNFSMLRDAYIRIMDPVLNQELVSFKLTDYYTNVMSMMIGEIYQHNGIWKFSSIGNGVAKDLAGLCELYGVQVE